MKLGTIVIRYVLAVLLAMEPPALAQTTREPNREWAAVMAVQPGERLALELRDGKRIEGKSSVVTETMLRLSDRNKVITLNREEAVKVWHLDRASAKKATLIGTALGTAAGAGLGASLFTGGGIVRRSQSIPVGAAVGTGVGALVGFAIGKGRSKRTLIYEVEK